MAVRGFLYGEIVYAVGRLVVGHVTMLSSRLLSLCGIRQSTRLIIVIASARVMRASGWNVPSDSPKSNRRRSLDLVFRP